MTIEAANRRARKIRAPERGEAARLCALARILGAPNSPKLRGSEDVQIA